MTLGSRAMLGDVNSRSVESASAMHRLSPAVATRTDQYDPPGFPPVAEQMEALEAALHTGRCGSILVHPTCGGEGFTTSAVRDGYCGECEFIRLGEGAWLSSGTLRLTKSRAIWSRTRDGVGIDIAIRGGWQFGRSLAPEELRTVSTGFASVSMLGPDSFWGSVPFVGMPIEYVGLQFRDLAAMRAFGLKVDHVMQLIGEPGMQPESSRRSLVVESGPDMLGVARAVRQAEFKGGPRLLYLRGKAYELLAHLSSCKPVCDAKLVHDGAAANDASLAALALSALGDGSNGVDLGSLARRFNVAETRLTRAFKATYGTTPFGYANRARVARGREMLQASHRSLIDIALACGYEHHSSFTTAYRRAFGETPRETRTAARRREAESEKSRQDRPPRVSHDLAGPLT